MPELPDVTVYVEPPAPRVVGSALENVRFARRSSCARSTPPLRDAYGKRVRGVTRLGKRIVLHLDDDLIW